MTGESIIQVLVVDDDPGIRQTLCAVMEDEGYTALEAADGASALALLRGNSHPVVVVLDLLMPLYSGEYVLQAVVNDHHLSTRHAYMMLTAQPECITPACATYIAQLDMPVISKPFELDALLDAVTRAACRLAARHGLDGATRSSQSSL